MDRGTFLSYDIIYMYKSQNNLSQILGLKNKERHENLNIEITLSGKRLYKLLSAFVPIHLYVYICNKICLSIGI